MVQFPALKAAIRDGWYQVRIAKRDTGEAELSQRMNERLPEGAVVHIVPRQSGAKSGGVFQIIAGAALVAIGAVVTYFGGGAVGVPLMQTGGAMILGGVVQLLTPIPKTPSSATTDDGKNSTRFSSLVNMVAQGCCVPVAYGLIMTGSRVISEEVSSWDDATGSTVVLGAGD